MQEEIVDQPLKSPLDDLQPALQSVQAADAEATRSQKRYRRVFLTSGFAMASKVVTIGSTIVTIPMSLRYLGQERQGVWMAIGSSLALLGFADLGMGNGLINAVAEANGKDDQDRARRAHSNAFFLLLGIALLLGAIALAAMPFVPFADVFRARTALGRAEATPAMAVTGAIILANLPLGTLGRVLSGYQEGARIQVFSLFSALCAIGFMYAVTKTSGGLPWLIAAFGGGPTVLLGLYWLYEFFVRRPWLRPRLADLDRSVARSLFRTGALFMALQVFDSLLNFGDMLIITRVFGPQNLPSYGSVLKIVNALFIFQYLGPALWPAYGEAFARKDYGWIRRSFRKALLTNGWVTILACAAFAFGVKALIRLWLGEALVPTTGLVVSYTIYLFVMSPIGVFASLYNAGPLLKEHAKFFILAAIVAFALQIVLAHTIGIPGVVYGATISYGLLYVLPMFLRTNGILSRLEAR